MQVKHRGQQPAEAIITGSRYNDKGLGWVDTATEERGQ
jgi:hypothetical protein